MLPGTKIVLKLKEDAATSVAAVWEFLSQNNCGIMQLFQEADDWSFYLVFSLAAVGTKRFSQSGAAV